MEATRAPPPHREGVRTLPEQAILVDTSVWIDHLRISDTQMLRLLEDGRVLSHPGVMGEIALGNIQPRLAVLDGLKRLRVATLAEDAEVLDLVERYRLFGRGIGWVDAHLLTSALLTSALLLTRDRRLLAVADELGVAARL